MDFSEVAATETSTLVQHLERDLAELTGRLEAAAVAARQSAVAEVTSEAHAAAEVLRAELAERVAENAATTAALVELQSQADSLRAALADAKSQTDTLRTALAEANAETDGLRAALAEAQSQTDSLRAALESVEALLATARTELLESRRLVEQEEAAHLQTLAERDEALAARDTETAARVAAETEVQDLRDVIQEHERARTDLEGRLAASADSDTVAASLLDGLVSGFATLASATTIPDIMTTLVEQLAAEFPRVALFRPKANSLEGQHQIGFDLSNDITKVIMPLSLDSLLTRAATSGHLEAVNGREADATSHVPFGGEPLCAVAFPLVVQEETLGVVYADDAGSDRQDSAAERAARLKYCEAMQQHSVALLMRLTNELKTLAELRAYAGSLLNEIGEMYAADVAADKTPEELRRRLQANIEYARSIFATRVALECPDAERLLEDEIAAAIERERGAQFGQALEGAAGTGAAHRLRA